MSVWKLDTFLSTLSLALQGLLPFPSGSVVSSSNNNIGSVENVYLKDLSSTIRKFSTEPWSYVQIMMHKSALGGHFWRLAQLAAIEQLEQLGGL